METTGRYGSFMLLFVVAVISSCGANSSISGAEANEQSVDRVTTTTAGAIVDSGFAELSDRDLLVEELSELVPLDLLTAQEMIEDASLLVRIVSPGEGVDTYLNPNEISLVVDEADNVVSVLPS